jgi:thioester reductase-like protein
MATRKAPARKPAASRSQKAAPRRATSDRVVLFTGFPGFIGARLIPRLVELRPDTRFVCLVQEKFMPAAQDAVDALGAQHPGLDQRIELVGGDITAAGLGMDGAAARRLQKSVTGCFHLAAVYDLAVARPLGLRINVDGTRNVARFLQDCSRFTRLDYVSTAYVSGTAVGVYRETDLDVGQRFKNFYEETKFLAEKVVVESGLPTTTYRPGIVVGDSRTGATAKFDGPYFALNAMRVLPSPGLFMKVGTGTARVNLVPVDFVLEAIAQLASWDGALGVTYHLTDPNPLTAFEIEELFAKALGKEFVYLPVPTALAKLASGPLQRFLHMPAQTLDYFDHPVEYDARQATAHLAQFEVRCPWFVDYAQRLISFYLENVDRIKRGAMI